MRDDIKVPEIFLRKPGTEILEPARPVAAPYVPHCRGRRSMRICPKMTEKLGENPCELVLQQSMAATQVSTECFNECESLSGGERRPGLCERLRLTSAWTSNDKELARGFEYATTAERCLY
eukprot:Blabericola_migrator_1__4151@NODE_2269_length_3032_cov_7_550759_g1428_i0_p1_GENE_NODE_2269_length_3032_cov_7_550759_g1428_i0NODE_2269_length_3032_cov_7_550759_g1428_i0_p1_ORF_typecomplete_len121_score5_31_NODE_2269_length_3032_cov_7_550759_g1428_i07911153